MARVLIKISREEKDGVEQSFVLLERRVVEFDDANERNVYVQSGRSYRITVYCHGDKGASVTAKVEKDGGKVIDPLKALVKYADVGVGHADDRFTVQ